MLQKIISSQSTYPNPPKYTSISLMHELGIKSDDREQFIEIQRCIDCIQQEPSIISNRHLMAILSTLSPINSNIKNLHESIIKHHSLDKICNNPAYKALILIVRKWPKVNWHMHFSDHIDGHFVSEKLGLTANQNFDYRTSRNHINDDWIKSNEDFVSAFKYVITQLIEDGVSKAQIRFNPYKLYVGSDHHKRLENIEPILLQLQTAINETIENHRHQLNIDPEFTLIFSLNRRKYAQIDPQIMMDIIDQLNVIRNKRDDLNTLLYGIDICGGEILDWEWSDGHRTNWGSVLFEKLMEAKKTGYQIITHLGDIRNYNEALKEDFFNNPEPIIYSMLLNFESYLYELHGLNRIGHATIIHDELCTSKRSRQKLKDIIMILKGQIPNSAHEHINGMTKQQFLSAKYELERNGFLRGPLITDALLNLNQEGEKKLFSLLKSTGIDLTDTQAESFINILKQIQNCKNIKLERCFYDDVITLLDIHDKSPIFFWKEQGLNFVLGIDGFIHNRSHEFYDFFSDYDYHAVSLSQWIVMLMLAAPQTNGWTVNYVKSLAISNHE